MATASVRRMDGVLRLCSNIARRCANWLQSTANAIDARLTRSAVYAHHSSRQPQICQRERINHWIRKPSLPSITSSSFDFHEQLLRNLSLLNDLPECHQNLQCQSSGDENASLVVPREIVSELPASTPPTGTTLSIERLSSRREETIAEIMARSPASMWLAYLKLTGLSPKKAKPLYAALSESEVTSLEQLMQRRDALARLSDYPCKLTPLLKKQCSTLQAAREQWTKSAEANRPLRSLIQEVSQRLDAEVLSQNDRVQLVSDYNALLCLNGDQSVEVAAQQRGRNKKSFG